MNHDVVAEYLGREFGRGVRDLGPHLRNARVGAERAREGVGAHLVLVSNGGFRGLAGACKRMRRMREAR